MAQWVIVNFRPVDFNAYGVITVYDGKADHEGKFHATANNKYKTSKLESKAWGMYGASGIIRFYDYDASISNEYDHDGSEIVTLHYSSAYSGANTCELRDKTNPKKFELNSQWVKRTYEMEITSKGNTSSVGALGEIAVRIKATTYPAY
ncbi:hypothetical protein [Candidatus Albibeggiatoa sp. nov. NOAA]|uniref:hypothetical protein n=1 Tax=Candidatus Albibeggiatoa sp. nov. NOAA TaxID=3162724 RepID=UPI00330220F7|nr:hypothetical protein [Thiotrichaceae bacterium]